MKPEAQRIAIAEACGWTEIHASEFTDSPSGTFAEPPESWWKTAPSHFYCNKGRACMDLPNYLGDLNAMHEAEKALSNHQRAHYANCLNKLLFVDGDAVITYNDEIAPDLLEDFAVAHTTAAQRAEAFLRTLGLWQEQSQEQLA